MLQNLPTKICLIVVAALLCACGNKGDLFLELDDQVETTINQTRGITGDINKPQSIERDKIDSDDDEESEKSNQLKPETDN